LAEATRVHGGLQSRELAALGLDASAVLDLSVNVNPLGPHPDVVAAIRRASLSTYPEQGAPKARAALAQLCGLDEAHIVVGHGSTELIWSAVALCANDPRPLLIAGPTFCEPLLAARAYGVRSIELRARPEQDFCLDLAKLSHALEEHDAQAIYLCQPNNPDGGCIPAARLRELCEAHRSRFFLIDQAFLNLSTRHAELALRFPDNVLLVRSLTKEHALPGLRVGYALGAPAYIEQLNARRPSWMVSALAEAAIVEACAQPEHVTQARAVMLDNCSALFEACREQGYRALPSTTSYLLLRVGAAERMRKRLLAKHAIAVRSCESFGLPEFVRIAGCDAQQRVRLMAALVQEHEHE
jgi:histidinol-phosphate/aromatic aminotransferase/cobyric acid decarboxylase-like protein